MYRGLFVRQISVPDPLAERRARWVELMPEEVAVSGVEAALGSKRPGRRGSKSLPAQGTPRSTAVMERAPDGLPTLELQLLPEPRPIRIRGRTRRDHIIPLRYHEEGGWHDLTSAGPDRISGGHEEARPYSREYYRCVNDAGALLWIYRDAIEDRWFLHGWWG
jgi:hypothetical protein